MGLFEFYKILECNKAAFPLKWVNALNGTLFFSLSSLIIFNNWDLRLLLICWVFLLIIIAAELYRKSERAFDNIAYSVLGLIWIALPLSGIALLFDTTLYDGDRHILAMALFVFIWVNDTGAYVFGICFGKRRLFERISPKKSWEGFAGGIISTVVTGIIVSFFWTGFSFLEWIIFGLIIAVSGTFGDLTESLFKRCLNFKDSGHFFPGHGGFLDRFDSVFLAVPAILFYLYIIRNFL